MRWFVLAGTLLAFIGVVFGYFVVLPAAEHFLTGFDSTQLHYLPQAKPFLSFCVNMLLAMALVFELPIFMSPPTQLGIVPTEKLKKNRRTGIFAVVVLGLCLPGVDFVTTFFEVAPLVILFEASIWVSTLSRPAARRNASRAQRYRREAGGLRPAGWSRSTAPRSRTASSPGRTGGSSRSAADRAERHHDGAIILPGLVNAHSHLEYAVYAGFGDGEPFGSWLGTHIARKRALEPRRHGRDRPPRRRRLAHRGDHHHGRLQLLGGRRQGGRTTLGLRAIVYLEVFGTARPPRPQLVCPCHQSMFDVTNGCEPNFGPAPRPLPQLPIYVDGRRLHRAQSDYLEPVGPGFWERS